MPKSAQLTMKRWKSIRTASILMLALTLVLSACGGDFRREFPVRGKKKVTIMLDWLPNTNHTGLYVAQSKGYFAEEGLEVEMSPRQNLANELVGAGKAPFGISSQEYVTQAQAQGVPIVSIAAILQHNTSDSPPQREKDPLAQGFRRQNVRRVGNADRERLHPDGAGAGRRQNRQRGRQGAHRQHRPGRFLHRRQAGYRLFLDLLRLDGHEASFGRFPGDVIYLKDLDPVLDFYTPTIITNEEMIRKVRIRRGSSKAVKRDAEFASTRPGEAANILIEAVPSRIPIGPEIPAVDVGQTVSGRLSPAWGVQREEVWVDFTIGCGNA